MPQVTSYQSKEDERLSSIKPINL